MANYAFCASLAIMVPPEFNIDIQYLIHKLSDDFTVVSSNQFDAKIQNTKELNHNLLMVSLSTSFLWCRGRLFIIGYINSLHHPSCFHHCDGHK